MLFYVGRASGTKLCRLLWRVPLQRQLNYSVHQKLLQLLNGEMSWKENSSLLRLWPYQGKKHTVSQNGEFIARYC